MATRDGFGGVHKLLEDGHVIEFSVNFTKFASSLLEPFGKSFTFPCKVSPTRWSFRMTLRQASTDSNVGCLVEIKRIDTSEISMKAEFSMRLFPVMVEKLPPLIFKTETIQAGATEENRTFEDVVPIEVLRRVGDGEVLFHISFEVRGCHQEEVEKQDGTC